MIPAFRKNMTQMQMRNRCNREADVQRKADAKAEQMKMCNKRCNRKENGNEKND